MSILSEIILIGFGNSMIGYLIGEIDIIYLGFSMQIIIEYVFLYY